MQYKVIKQPRTFTPFQIHLRIDTVDDLKELWLRFTESLSHLDEDDFKNSVNIAKQEHQSYHIWKMLGKELEEIGELKSKNRFFDTSK